MKRCIFNGVAHAYCPKYDEERRIGLRLDEVVATNSQDYNWQYFNCMEQFTCEHFNRRFGCPFIREVYDYHK